MKKRTVLVGMLAALTMFAAGCGGKDAAKESKVLRAGTEPTFAPFEFQEKDSKDFTGFDMDLIRAIGKQMGRDVEIKNMGFDALIPAINSGNIDVVASGMSITEERKKAVTFSDPYYKASQRLVTLADDTAFDDCKDAASVEEVLKGLSASDKIGGQQGTTAQYFVEGSDDWGFEGLPAEWVPYKSASLAVQDMINGNVKYVIIDAAPAESITKAINAMQ